MRDHTTDFRFFVLAAALSAACESSRVVVLPPEPAGDVAVTGFSPTKGFAGDLVEVSGRGFGRDLAAIEVLFNGYGARPEDVDADGTLLRVRVPAGVASGQLTVVAPLGRATTADRFEYRGGGHLTRGAASRSFHMGAGLGALQQRGGDFWALATTLHQLVNTGDGSRVRLDVAEPPVDVAVAPDAWGRTLVLTKAHVLALPLGNATGPRLDVTLPTSELFRLVPLQGRSVLAIAPRAAYIVLLGPEVPDDARVQAISPGDAGIARIIDGTVDADGVVYLACDDLLQRPLVLVSDPPRKPKALTPPARLAGPLVRIDDGGHPLLVAATLDGRLAVATLEDGNFAPQLLDLLASGPAYALAADPVRKEIYATVPTAGRLVAVTNPASPRVGWTVALGGSPRGLALAGDRLLVANTATNAVQIVDLETRALLGEKRVDLGAGSPLGGRHGLDVVRLAASEEAPAEDLALVLSRAADALVGLDPTTASPREPALLAPKARAFAASGAGFAIVSHDDGGLGRVDFGHMRVASAERVLCGDGLGCPGALPLSLDVAGDDVLVVTAKEAQVRDAKTLQIKAIRAAHDGGFYAGGRLTGPGVALEWMDKAVGPTRLSFIHAASPDALAAAAPVSDENAPDGKVLAPRGVTIARSLGGSDVSSPIFLFLRNAALQPAPWGFAPERLTQTLVPTPNLGFAPAFAPDGRQIAGVTSTPDGLAAAVVFVRGDFLAGEPLTPQAVADLSAIPTGFAYAPSGERAVTVLGSTDTLVLFE